MASTEKLWGMSHELFFSDAFSLYRCQAVAGGFCSKHWHENKVNLFQVESGLLVVELFPQLSGPGSAPRGTICLFQGQSLIVPARQVHRFLAQTDCQFWEAYWPRETGGPLDREDIHRLELGGVLESPNHPTEIQGTPCD